MLVCHVSAIDRLIDMYGDFLSVSYKDNIYNLYDLRDFFVDNNIECSLDLHKVSSTGIQTLNGIPVVLINTDQGNSRDDLINL